MENIDFEDANEHEHIVNLLWDTFDKMSPLDKVEWLLDNDSIFDTVFDWDKETLMSELKRLKAKMVIK